MPSRDYDANRMLPSRLQLGAGSVLLVDETCMTEGTLTDNGVKSVRALNSVAVQQKLPIHFGYYELQVPTDYTVVFFSQDSQSTLFCPGGESIKIRTTSTAAVASGAEGMDVSSDSFVASSGGASSTAMDTSGAGSVLAADSADVNLLRRWWGTVRLLEVSMDADLVTHAEEEFVQARRADESVTPGDLHRWLAIARLVALSCGSAQISMSHWLHMRRLETNRAASLSA
jgi:Mini-chromosome maintenance replisome factor